MEKKTFYCVAIAGLLLSQSANGMNPSVVAQNAIVKNAIFGNEEKLRKQTVKDDLIIIVCGGGLMWAGLVGFDFVSPPLEVVYFGDGLDDGFSIRPGACDLLTCAGPKFLMKSCVVGGYVLIARGVCNLIGKGCRLVKKGCKAGIEILSEKEFCERLKECWRGKAKKKTE